MATAPERKSSLAEGTSQRDHFARARRVGMDICLRSERALNERASERVERERKRKTSDAETKRNETKRKEEEEEEEEDDDDDDDDDEEEKRKVK